MRGLGVVEEQGIFDLGRVADHAIIANDDVFADVGIMAYPAIAADNGRPLDHDTVLQQGAFADENLFADESLPFAAVVQTRSQMGGQKGGNFRQYLPGITATLENRACRVWLKSNNSEASNIAPRVGAAWTNFKGKIDQSSFAATGLIPQRPLAPPAFTSTGKYGKWRQHDRMRRIKSFAGWSVVLLPLHKSLPRKALNLFSAKITTFLKILSKIC